MPADRDDARIDVLRDRLFLRRWFLRGLGRVLLFQPFLDLRIGEQCNELGDLRRRRRLSVRRRCPARYFIRRRSGPRQQGGRQNDRRNAGPQRSQTMPIAVWARGSSLSRPRVSGDRNVVILISLFPTPPRSRGLSYHRASSGSYSTGFVYIGFPSRLPHRRLAAHRSSASTKPARTAAFSAAWSRSAWSARR